jgi:hypothetical protein
MKGFVKNIWVARLFLFLLGASLVVNGLDDVISGDLHYSNYWGGAVFAPLGMVVGVFLLVLLVRQWKTLTTPETPPKLKGRAARLARKAEETKFPIDDYRKW